MCALMFSLNSASEICARKSSKWFGLWSLYTPLVGRADYPGVFVRSCLELLKNSEKTNRRLEKAVPKKTMKILPPNLFSPHLGHTLKAMASDVPQTSYCTR